MSVASQVALAVAERVERTGGVRAGLVAYRALANGSGDQGVRGKALLAALRCAAALRDGVAASELAGLWAGVAEGVWDDDIIVLCKDLYRSGLVPAALDLSCAEAYRHRTARSLYLHARCLELSPAARDSAAERFREASARAAAEGAADLESAARVRRALLLSRAWPTMAEALDEAVRVDVATATASSKLDVAAVLLHAPSRFVRATALGFLDELVTGGEPALSARALRLAARFADEAFPSLGPLEVDRLIALFGRERVRAAAPRAIEVATALRRIAAGDDAAFEAATALEPSLGPIVERARDILRGRFEPARTPVAAPSEGRDRRALRAGLVLDAVVAMRDGAPARAAHALDLLTTSSGESESLPREALAIAHVALAGGDTELRASGLRVVAAFLAKPSYMSPTGGFLPLAELLGSTRSSADLTTNEELAALARRAAAVRKEPGAAEALGTALARAGWDHARRGERAEAISKLREAKALLDVSASGASATHRQRRDPVVPSPSAGH